MVKRVEFETNGEGTPILSLRESLYGNATYHRVFPREYVPNRLKGSEAVANWVRNAVVGDLETLDRGIAAREKDAAGGGNFLLLIGCMMAIEYFATIFDGSSKLTKQRVVGYARTFMANERYETCLPALMAARDGIVHGSWPMRVRVDGKEYPFAVGYDYPESCVHLHLSLHKDDDEPEDREKLFVNPRIMLADLKDSVMREPDGFRLWILSRASDDEAIAKRAQPSVIPLGEAELEQWKKK